MKTHVLILLFLLGFSSGCNSASTNLAVPDVHRPTQLLAKTDLDKYVLAFCWRSPERDAFGYGRSDIGVSNGNAIITITYPLAPRQSPVSLGCYKEKEQFRAGLYGLSWRPQHNQLATIYSQSSLEGDGFYFINAEAGLNFKFPESRHWENERYFYHPNILSWSPDGEWLVTLGQNASGMSIPNIWLYSPDTHQALQITHDKTLRSYLANASWSPNSKHLAIGFRIERSGISLVNIETLASTDISNENQQALSSWPYSLNGLLAGSNTSRDWYFQMYLGDGSQPAWIDQGRRVVFVAPASGNRVTLFVIKSDGTELQELIPNLSGLVGLPHLSPDQKKLLFVHYPSWQTRDRAEIATLDLLNNEWTSLAVLPKPINGDELYIGGLDWSPDGKYIAFSSNHEGQSDIYVMTANGDAWSNLTANWDGDAVNPVWKP